MLIPPANDISKCFADIQFQTFPISPDLKRRNALNKAL